MPKRFKIIWHAGSYRVSIPNYEGGDVVDAASFDALVQALIQIDTLATCTGVVDPSQHKNMLDNIYRIARDAITDAVGGVGHD